MIIKPNQPVLFNGINDTCSTDTPFTQIVDNTDITQFQLGLELCVSAAQEFPDPNFSDPANFVLYSGWSISNNVLCRTATTGTAIMQVIYPYLVIDSYYKMTVVVDSCDGQFDVFIGANFVGSFFASGAYEFYGFQTLGVDFTITPHDSTAECCISAITAFEILTNVGVAIVDSDDTVIADFDATTYPEYFTFVDGTVTVSINWSALGAADGCYRIKLSDPCNGVDFDYESNTFSLSDYSCYCPETLYINAANAEDGLGFVFNGSGFSPRLRLQAKLKQAKYKSERTLEEDSNGTKRVIYFNRRKQKNLVADLLPEYIHDFLSTLQGYDIFYINGVPYVVEDDEYNVTYDQSQDNAGSISLLVSEQTQLIRNVHCSSEDASYSIPQLSCGGITPTENVILLEDGTNLRLEDNTNFLLEN